VLLFLLCGLPSVAGRSVVVYSSVDQVFSEPIFRAFEAHTGIRVLAVYDVESAKTTGLTTRLIAEKAHPRADVFWNSEFANTLRLQHEGVLAPYRSPRATDLPAPFRDPAGYWAGMGGRPRVLLVNTRLLTPRQYPSSLLDMLSPRWAGEKIGMAYPLFGTAATHAAALYATLGPKKARAFFQQVKARGVRILDGNSVVRDQVVTGQLAWGVTDSDDAVGALARKGPVAIVVPDQRTTGALLIPGTVALLAGAPHLPEARALIDYLVAVDTERALLRNGGCQFSLRALSRRPSWLATPLHPLAVPLTAIYRQLPVATAELREIFVR